MTTTVSVCDLEASAAKEYTTTAESGTVGRKTRCLLVTASLALLLTASTTVLALYYSKTSSSPTTFVMVDVQVPFATPGASGMIVRAAVAPSAEGSGTPKWHLITRHLAGDAGIGCAHVLHTDGMRYDFKSMDCTFSPTDVSDCIKRVAAVDDEVAYSATSFDLARIFAGHGTKNVVNVTGDEARNAPEIFIPSLECQMVDELDPVEVAEEEHTQSALAGHASVVQDLAAVASVASDSSASLPSLMEGDESQDGSNGTRRQLAQKQWGSGRWGKQGYSAVIPFMRGGTAVWLSHAVEQSDFKHRFCFDANPRDREDYWGYMNLWRCEQWNWNQIWKYDPRAMTLGTKHYGGRPLCLRTRGSDVYLSARCSVHSKWIVHYVINGHPVNGHRTSQSVTQVTGVVIEKADWRGNGENKCLDADDVNWHSQRVKVKDCIAGVKTGDAHPHSTSTFKNQVWYAGYNQ